MFYPYTKRCGGEGGVGGKVDSLSVQIIAKVNHRLDLARDTKDRQKGQSSFSSQNSYANGKCNFHRFFLIDTVFK